MANSVTIRTTAPGAKDAAKDVKGLGDAYKKMGDDGKGVGDKMKILGAGMTATGKQLTMGVTLPLLAAGGAAIKLAIDAEETEAKLNAAFTSMGASSWTSMEKLRSKAEELMSRTTFDDEAIKEAQAVMLTFGNVTGESFDDGIEAALNMSTALGTDLQSSVIMLGKALNDPVKGITAMTRAGVSFTAEQKDMIKSMVAMGDTAGAQTLILAEMERQFGGMAEAVAQTTGGQMKQAMNELGEVGEDVGKILLPVVRDAAGHLRNLADVFQNLSPEVKSAIVTFAGLAAALGPVLLVGGKLIGMFSGVAGVIATLVTKIAAMTAATVADTAATNTNTTAKNLNAKALLGVGAGAAAVVGGLIAVNEGLNASSEKVRAFTTAVEGMSEEQRAAAAAHETLGVKTGDVTRHFANFLSVVAPWHQVAADAQAANDALNTSLAEQEGNLQRSEAAWRSYIPPVKQATSDVEDSWQRMGTSADRGADEVTDSWQRMGLDVVHTMAETRRDSLTQMDRLADDLVGTVRGAKGDLKNSMEDLMWAIKHPLAATRRIAEIEGALTGKALGDGLQSKNPFIRAVAEQTKADLIQQWEQIAGRAYKEGVQTQTAYADGVKDGPTAKARVKFPGGTSGGTHGGDRGHQRASGGPVEEGVPYTVGERGMEVFVPDQNGQIIPNNKLGGGPSRIDVHVNLSTRDFAQHQRHYAVIQGGAPAF